MDSRQHFQTSSSLLILPTLLTKTVKFDVCLECHKWEVTSFFLGLAIHLGLFRRGEWDLAASSICKAYALTFVLLNAVLLFASSELNSSVVLDILLEACALFAAHVFGLAASICAYRCLFHRLGSFPGPPLASISGFYMLFLGMKYHQSEVIQQFHQSHGDFVRIAPDKLSTVDPAAIAAIYGRGSTACKGPFSNMTHPRENLNMCRAKVEHARRRKHWDRAMNTYTLRSHVPTVTKHTQRLLSQLQARAGQSVEAAKWLALFGFDVLFDLGFGRDMQRINLGEEDFYVTCAQQILRLTGLFMHTPWMIHFCVWVPSLRARFGRFRAWSEELVRDRLDYPETGNDIFSSIARSFDEISSKSPQDVENLAGDADLLVLAGSDSIAGATSAILYELAMNPEEQDKLRHELANMEDGEDLQIRGNTHLDAVINESLRLNPPAPAGHERMTPPQGLRIGERYIPGNVTVFVPHYALFRDARFFEDPDSFIPERWTTRQQLNKNAAVFIPFQTGANACAGRNLAFMEMRSVIFSVVSKFNIQPAFPDTKSEFIEKRDDRWLLGVGELNLVFQER